MVWWKIYFWIIVFISALVVIFVYGKADIWMLPDWWALLGGIIGILILYSYIYKKRIFDSRVWKIIFWVGIAATVWDFVYTFSALKNIIIIPSILQSSFGKTTGSDLLFALFIGLPMIYANFKLAYPKKSK